MSFHKNPLIDLPSSVYLPLEWYSNRMKIVYPLGQNWESTLTTSIKLRGRDHSNLLLYTVGMLYKDKRIHSNICFYPNVSQQFCKKMSKVFSINSEKYWNLFTGSPLKPNYFNRSSRRKRGIASNPIFIIKSNLAFKELLNKEQIGNSEPFPATSLPVYLMNSEQIGISEQFCDDQKAP